MVRVIEYLKTNQTLGLGVVVGAFTFEMIEAVKASTLDPLFEEIVDRSLFDMKINFGSKTLDFGRVLYEIFRWYCYVSITFIVFELYSKGVFVTLQESVWTIIIPTVIVLVLERMSPSKKEDPPKTP